MTDKSIATQETETSASTPAPTNADAQAAGDDAPPNPFKLLAMVFRDLRASLEEAGAAKPPRWVRIARARHALVRPSAAPRSALSEANKTNAAPADALARTNDETAPAEKKASRAPEEVMSDGIGALLGGFINALSFIAELVLDLQEILIQVDAGKALIELSADLAGAVTSEEFAKGVESLTTVKPPLGDVNDLFENLKKLVGYAPEKEDLDCVSRELFLLLRVAYRADGEVHTLDVDNTGKIRLMQWAYGRGYTVRGLGFGESESRASVHLGARWLATAKPSTETAAAYKGETVLAVDFTGDPDFAELRGLLEALGYLDANLGDEAASTLSGALKRFQETNGLDASGVADEATINLLHNLDCGRELLRRALPSGAKPRAKQAKAPEGGGEGEAKAPADIDAEAPADVDAKANPGANASDEAQADAEKEVKANDADANVDNVDAPEEAG